MENFNESVEEFTQRILNNYRVDIDVEYCKKHGIKFKNHEIDATKVDLFNSKSNKDAFEYVTKNI